VTFQPRDRNEQMNKKTVGVEKEANIGGVNVFNGKITEEGGDDLSGTKHFLRRAADDATKNNSTGDNAFWGKECGNYFCDKSLDNIFIVMTHNSLALPGKVLSPNQNNGLKKQFEDGIRGFNLDLYMKDGGIWTYHGLTNTMGYNPESEVNDLINAMNEKQHQEEFVVVQLQDAMDHVGRDILVGWFGSLLVKDFDIKKTLDHYINQGQRVLIVTSKEENINTTKGIHDTNEVITENNYKWRECYLEGPLTGYRRGPETGQSAKLMNSFCSKFGIGDEKSSEEVNGKDKILYNAQNFLKLPFAQNKINIILVDYYETGDVFGAQETIREGRLNETICWGDGATCAAGTTCDACCNSHSLWPSKYVTACGKEPCWSDGTACDVGTTCEHCCNEAGNALETKCGGETSSGGTKFGAGFRCKLLGLFFFFLLL